MYIFNSFCLILTQLHNTVEMFAHASFSINIYRLKMLSIIFFSTASIFRMLKKFRQHFKHNLLMHCDRRYSYNQLFCIFKYDQ